MKITIITSIVIVLIMILVALLYYKFKKITDSTAHIWETWMIFFLCTVLGFQFIIDSFLTIPISLVITFVIVLVKEFIIDKALELGTFNWKDIGVSGWGGVLGIITSLAYVASRLDLGISTQK